MAHTRVVLACEPALLQDVLAMLLGERSDVDLLAADAPEADVVLVCVATSDSGWPTTWPPAAARAPRLIALDTVRNTLRLRIRRGGRVIERQFAADVATVVEVVALPPAAMRRMDAAAG